VRPLSSHCNPILPANNLMMTLIPTEAMPLSSTAVSLGKQKCEKAKDEDEDEDEDDRKPQIRKTEELKKTTARKKDDNSELNFFSMQEHCRHT
jgi:hypothetical protein